MGRRILALMLVGIGTVGIALASLPRAVAGQDPQQSASRDREEGDQDPAKRIDKAISTYENRADQELSATRKDIEKLRKDATELTELQFDMAVALAELQAELRAQATSEQDEGESASPGDGNKSASGDQERQRRRNMELNRELRQVRDSLSALVQQKRNETEQLVMQLRSLRAQQRQQAAAAERNRQSSRQDRDQEQK